MYTGIKKSSTEYLWKRPVNLMPKQANLAETGKKTEFVDTWMEYELL